MRLERSFVKILDSEETNYSLELQGNDCRIRSGIIILPAIS